MINKYGLALPLGVAGVSTGVGILGDRLGSEGLVSAGQTGASFVSPMVTIGMGGLVIGQLRQMSRGLKSLN